MKTVCFRVWLVLVAVCGVGLAGEVRWWVSSEGEVDPGGEGCRVNVVEGGRSFGARLVGRSLATFVW